MKGTDLDRIVNKMGWDQVHSSLMAEYAAYDTDLTLRLFEKLWPMVVAEGTVAQAKHKSQMTKLLIEIEHNGVEIDVPLCNAMAATGHKAMEFLLQELNNYNPSSHKQLDYLLIGLLKLDYIYNKKTGRPTFDAKAMERYEVILERVNDPTAKHILQFRGWQKSVSSNYEPYVRLRSPDGRLRPNFNQHRTKTGRLSCSDPNLQQIPKVGIKPWNGKMRKCFIAREGYELITFDFAQLEFRLGAAYANEKGLIEIFNDPDRDVFTEMSQVLSMSRDHTKTQVYSMEYGAGRERIMDVFGLSEHAAQQRINNFYGKFPGFKKIIAHCKYKAEHEGKVRIWSGRYRHFQYPLSESFKAFNSVMQGGAADIVEHTMLRCAAAGFNVEECRMLLQIHDEIVFEIRKDLVPKYVPAIIEVMQNVEPDFGVKFKVSSKQFGS